MNKDIIQLKPSIKDFGLPPLGEFGGVNLFFKGKEVNIPLYKYFRLKLIPFPTLPEPIDFTSEAQKIRSKRLIRNNGQHTASSLWKPSK
ncbi:MAG TPA: hypothetical protein VMR41_00290 [Patescibacteria group bacterium]|nr:hypothetical protein [Patescibacteria group bacterium]